MKKSPSDSQPDTASQKNALFALFIDELADIYDAENRLVRALPKLVEGAESEDLAGAFQWHLEETQGHVQKVERVFAAFGKAPKGKKCQAIVSLLGEAEEGGTAANDDALISTAQKIERYEIASYRCLHEWAIDLGNDDAADLLEEILADEKSANEKLATIARATCNAQAMAA